MQGVALDRPDAGAAGWRAAGIEPEHLPLDGRRPLAAGVLADTGEDRIPLPSALLPGRLAVPLREPWAARLSNGARHQPAWIGADGAATIARADASGSREGSSPIKRLAPHFRSAAGLR
jgi:hypothetical protein